MAGTSGARELAAQLFALAAEVEFRARAEQEPAGKIVGDTIRALARIRNQYSVARVRRGGQ